MIELLKAFSGKWTGAGVGEYPTISTFRYLEELDLDVDASRRILRYEQRTYRRNMDQTEYVRSHWESGILYLLEEGRVSVTNVQAGGRVEVLSGWLTPTPAGLTLQLESVYLGNDPRMVATTRAFTLSGDTLHYTMHMRTSGNPALDRHLEATLEREGLVEQA